jgi:ribonucleoside-diphosphate reductase alpha chain
MSRGLPYDSDEGRSYAAAITALMCAQAYLTSARLAACKGPFAGYERNREPFLSVMRKHQTHAEGIDSRRVDPELLSAARRTWADALAQGQQHGYRNSQSTVLAPTGTIAFMMDCDTTGIEPDLALVKYKKLVGGGMFKIVNNTVPLALKKLGYDLEAIQRIVDYVNENDTIEGAPSARLRLRVQALEGPALDPLHGARQDDGGDAAVHLRRHLQDRQHARRDHRRGDRAELPGSLEDGAQGDRHLP